MLHGTDAYGRRYVVAHCARFEHWQPASADYSSAYCLFVACDLPSWTVAEGLDFARRSLVAGCASVSTWGDNCELLHDLFDEEEVALELGMGRTATTITTWHKDESLEEALDFFFEHLIVSDDWGGQPQICVALTVGEPSLQARVEQYLKARLGM